MKKYKCEICNKEHSVFYFSESPLPDVLSQIEESEQEERLVKIGKSAFILDNENLFIKGNLQIETDFSEFLIEHYVWTEIPLQDFDKNYKRLNSGKQIKLKGKLVSELPFFEESINLKTSLTLDKSNIIGQLKIETDSQLKVDQQTPISKNRFIEMMQWFNHPELLKEKIKFSKPFKDRLFDILSQADLEYKSKGRIFVINLDNQRENLFQLVSSELLAIPTKKEIGLHLSNDSINSNYEEVKERMISLCENNSIDKLIWDNIDTYQKSYQTGDEEIYEDIVLIIKKVFEENIEEVELDIFES